MINFDELSMGLSAVTIILGLLSVIIVGSQTHEDARSVAIWSLVVLIPMLLVSGSRLAISGRHFDFRGGSGMVVLFSGLIAAIGLGYRIAIMRYRASQALLKGKKVEPGLWDDEFF
jgi:hypothetical protein